MLDEIFGVGLDAAEQRLPRRARAHRRRAGRLQHGAAARLVHLGVEVLFAVEDFVDGGDGEAGGGGHVLHARAFVAAGGEHAFGGLHQVLAVHVAARAPQHLFGRGRAVVMVQSHQPSSTRMVRVGQ